MHNTQTVEIDHEYRNLPIATLVESPTNPRKRFDERTLGELAASFKTQGVLEPLLVRPLEETKYEVVIGARRLKAARLAELESVPVRVVKLTNAEAIEAQGLGQSAGASVGAVEESRLAHACAIHHRQSVLQPSPGFGQAPQSRDRQNQQVTAGSVDEESRHL